MADADCTRTHICAYCGTEFGGRKKRFCSTDCQIKAKTGHDPAGHKCHECGARFTGRKKKYCSTACADEAKRQRDILKKAITRRAQGQKPRATAISHLQGTPIYKRIMRFRSARSGGRVIQYRPLNDGERAIWQAHQARKANWARYLKACDAIDNPKEPSVLALMTDEQRRATDARRWQWRYNNDPEFRAKQKARLLAKKQRRRYQKKLTDDGTVTGDVIYQRKDCVYCGAPLTPESRTIDHMIPLNLGGTHSASNVTACCLSCNSKKRDLPFDEWLERLDEPHRSNAEREYVRKQGAHPNQLTLTAVASHP